MLAYKDMSIDRLEFLRNFKYTKSDQIEQHHAPQCLTNNNGEMMMNQSEAFMI
jgi:hypothetical protein